MAAPRAMNNRSISRHFTLERLVCDQCQHFSLLIQKFLELGDGKVDMSPMSAVVQNVSCPSVFPLMKEIVHAAQRPQFARNVPGYKRALAGVGVYTDFRSMCIRDKQERCKVVRSIRQVLLLSNEAAFDLSSPVSITGSHVTFRFVMRNDLTTMHAFAALPTAHQ